MPPSASASSWNSMIWEATHWAVFAGFGLLVVGGSRLRLRLKRLSRVAT